MKTSRNALKLAQHNENKPQNNEISTSRNNGNKPEHNEISTTQRKQAATQLNCVVAIWLCCGDLAVLCTTGPL